MKFSNQPVEKRIEAFMTKKLAKYPELEKKRVQKITVHQRGRFFDEVKFTFATMKVGV